MTLTKHNSPPLVFGQKELDLSVLQKLHERRADDEKALLEIQNRTKKSDENYRRYLAEVRRKIRAAKADGTTFSGDVFTDDFIFYLGANWDAGNKLKELSDRFVRNKNGYVALLMFQPSEKKEPPFLSWEIVVGRTTGKGVLIVGNDSAKTDMEEDRGNIHLPTSAYWTSLHRLDGGRYQRDKIGNIHTVSDSHDDLYFSVQDALKGHIGLRSSTTCLELVFGRQLGNFQDSVGDQWKKVIEKKEFAKHRLPDKANFDREFAEAMRHLS